MFFYVLLRKDKTNWDISNPIFISHHDTQEKNVYLTHEMKMMIIMKKKTCITITLQQEKTPEVSAAQYYKQLIKEEGASITNI